MIAEICSPCLSCTHGCNPEFVMSNKNSTEDDPYKPVNVPLYESIYGKNLISLGGLAAIDNMFSDLNLTELTVLDLGFGLGGVAFYLAEKFQMNIFGIEIHPWMVQYAKDHTPKNLSSQLEFDTYDEDGKLPCKSETFDMVYSKGVLNHVPYKENLFHQVNAVLKPGGLFVIADWIFPEIISDSTTPLVCETKESYQQILHTCGFNEIKFRDDSKLFLGYTKELLLKLFGNEEFIKHQYGQKLFSILQQQHEELIVKIQQQQKSAVRIVAKKD